MSVSKKTQTELIEQLAVICEELEWNIALPTTDEIVPGLIIGTPVFIRDVVSVVYGDNYDVFTKSEFEDGMTEVIPVLEGKKNGPSYH